MKATIGSEVIIAILVVSYLPPLPVGSILLALFILFSLHATYHGIVNARRERAYQKARARFWAERDSERRGVPFRKRYEKMEAYGRAFRQSHPRIAAMFAERVNVTRRVLAAYHREHP